MQVCEILLIINLLLLFIMYAVDCVIRTDRPSSVRNESSYTTMSIYSKYLIQSKLMDNSMGKWCILW